MADIRDLMGDDQMVFATHRRLHIVANHAGAFAIRRHGPCVGIGRRSRIWRRSASKRSDNRLIRISATSLQAMEREVADAHDHQVSEIARLQAQGSDTALKTHPAGGGAESAVEPLTDSH
jgi:hypothetical protein